MGLPPNMKLVTGVTARGIPGKADDYKPAPTAPAKRRNHTDLRHEFLRLWHQLGSLEFVPASEFRFHPTRRWRFDVAWPGPKVALELEGGVWVNGGHNRGAGLVGDMEKMNAATSLGWRILRYTADDLRKRPVQVVEEVKRALET